MKKELRVSSMKDYIAVDIVDETKPSKPIESTPLYLSKGKSVIVKGYDEEQNQWFLTKLLFDGEKIHCEDVDTRSDSQGLQYEATPDDLIDPKQFRY